ncbi:hypothetical protein [Streptomyces sp. NPDC093094]|uniref:hypothetical protein n=1 Tax=Streptomyces sp. NPDC093094 TaxID=3366026 RepID=UPI00381417C1
MAVSVSVSVAAWWYAARLFTARPHPVLVVLADSYGSLSRTTHIVQWLGPYCLATAGEEGERARRTPGRRPIPCAPSSAHAAGAVDCGPSGGTVMCAG